MVTVRLFVPIAACLMVAFVNVSAGDSNDSLWETYEGDLLQEEVLFFECLDTEIEDVLKTLGDITGLKFLIAEGVQGKVTLRLRNHPLSSVLKEILGPNSWDYEVTDGSITVKPIQDGTAPVVYRNVTGSDNTQKVTVMTNAGIIAINTIPPEDPLNRKVPLVSIRDPDINNVLSLLSVLSGLNIILPEEGIEGRLKKHIGAKTIRQALDMTLTPNGYCYEVQGEDLVIKKAVIRRKYKLGADSAKHVFEILKSKLYGNQDKQEELAEGWRRLSLDPESNIVTIEDTLDQLIKAEKILIEQKVRVTLSHPELFARDFTILVESQPPARMSSEEWAFRRQLEYDSVVNLVKERLYESSSEGEAKRLGRRLFTKSNENPSDRWRITVVDTVENFKKVEELLKHR